MGKKKKQKANMPMTPNRERRRKEMRQIIDAAHEEQSRQKKEKARFSKKISWDSVMAAAQVAIRDLKFKDEEENKKPAPQAILKREGPKEVGTIKKKMISYERWYRLVTTPEKEIIDLPIPTTDAFSIMNTESKGCLINADRHLVYSAPGKIANVSGLYFRVNYRYSKITMKLIEKEENDVYVARKEVLSANKISQLYKLLDPKSYIEQFEEIRPSKNNPEEFVIKVSGVWFDHTGNKVASLNNESFAIYCERIANIKQAKIHGEVILAKPVLLLALIEGVKEMLFRNNRFVLNNWLETHYEKLMRNYTKNSIFANITPINNPFWHLQSDGFWHLHYNGAKPTIINTPSVRWLEDNVNYASFDDDLWTLLQDRTSRQQLREFIVEHKLPKVK